MWSRKYDKCIICGTDKIKHNGKGLCKNCCAKKYREKNPEKIKEDQRRWREENPKKVKENNKKWHKWYKKNKDPEVTKKKWKEWYKKNSEKHKTRVKKWQKENPEKVNKKSRKGYKEHPEKVRESNRLKKINRYHNDVRFKLKCNVSSLINKRLKKRSSSKKGNNTFSFLPYTIDDLMQHLEKLFRPGMTWKNRGQFGWHIDHKKPDSLFNYRNIDDKEFQECWSLKNLQPLWAKDNLRKSNKIIN